MAIAIAFISSPPSPQGHCLIVYPVTHHQHHPPQTYKASNQTQIDPNSNSSPRTQPVHPRLIWMKPPSQKESRGPGCLRVVTRSVQHPKPGRVTKIPKNFAPDQALYNLCSRLHRYPLLPSPSANSSFISLFFYLWYTLPYISPEEKLFVSNLSLQSTSIFTWSIGEFVVNVNDGRVNASFFFFHKLPMDFFFLISWSGCFLCDGWDGMNIASGLGWWGLKAPPAMTTTGDAMIGVRLGVGTCAVHTKQ